MSCLLPRDSGGATHGNQISSMTSMTNQLRKLEWMHSHLFVLSSLEMHIHKGLVANDPVIRVCVCICVQVLI